MKRDLNTFWGSISSINGFLILLISINQIFMINPFGFVLQENSYFYILIGLSLTQVYILHSFSKKTSNKIPFYDVILGLTGLAFCSYLAYQGLNITSRGWMFAPPNKYIIMICLLLAILILEALRRVAGFPLFTVCCFFALYPTFAHYMPSFLEGQSFSFFTTFTFHLLSPQSIVGIPIRVVALLLIGYIVFGVVLNNFGGGDFFFDFSSSIFGKYRGGSGKIAVLASALFGSMSGSAISNVMTTGVMTIPAMKNSGFKPKYAGAIEACASTGGVLMPPIMGAAAFLMAQFLGVPYITVLISAIVPSILYYTGLLIQVDAYAAKNNIKGIPVSQLPKMGPVLKKGWVYVAGLFVLIYFLYLRIEDQAPFYTILFILLALMIKKETRPNIASILNLLKEIGCSVSELILAVGSVGFVIGALSLTGVGASISSELVGLAGGNVYLMLLLGAFASFILGMGMTTSACYIFLAIVLAPGLVGKGFNPIAVHLFILYWAMASNITPPVALACMPAAAIAKTSFIEVGLQAIRFGFVTLIVPFMFVLNPAIIFEGEPLNVIVQITLAFVGIVLASFGMGRYFPYLGILPIWKSTLFVLFGLAIALPTHYIFTSIALACCVTLILGMVFYRRTKGKHINYRTF